MIDPRAERVARAFAADLAVAAPQLVDRVHLTGSALTADWREGRSDVDLVLRLAREVASAEAATLSELHRRYGGVDAIYLTADQLEAGPEIVTEAPQAIAGKFNAAMSDAQLTWVTWLELEVGATLDGGHVEPFMGDTADRAAAASRRNLRDYWLPLGRMAAIKFALVKPSAQEITWIALGPPRLVVTIEQGRIISKTEAGEFASGEWPQFADMLGRVLHYRATGEGSFTRGDARQAVLLLRLCVERGTRYS